jgi:hypothetical protein
LKSGSFCPSGAPHAVLVFSLMTSFTPRYQDILYTFAIRKRVE